MRTRSALAVASISALLGACAAVPDDGDEHVGQITAAAGGAVLYPDLVVSSVVAPAYIEGEIDATITVCNRGDADAPASYVNVVLSRTDDWAYPYAVGGSPVPALAIDECTTVHGHGLDMSTSAQYIGAVIDPDNVIAERNETNNLRKGRRVVFGPAPDLYVSAVTGPKDFSSTTPVTLTARVCNRGTAPASGSRTDFYVSQDATITASDQSLGSAPAPALDPGACADVTAELGIIFPTNLVSPLYFGAIADGDGAILESNDNNNARASAVTGWGDGPDLYVSTWSMPTDVDGEFSANITVCNQGFTTTAGNLYFYFAQEPTFDRNDPNFNQTGNWYVDPIDPGACVTTSMLANPPGPVGLGPTAWYAAVEVDGGPADVQQGNDRSASKVIGVGHGSDQVVRSITVPASVQQGQPFDATFRVCNQGTDAMPSAVTLTAYLSTDSTIDATDMYEGTAWIDVLAAGACRNVIVSMYADLAPGGVFVGAIVDPASGELLTTNDSNRRALTITP